MEAFKWLVDKVSSIAPLWETITTPVFTIGDLNVSWIGVLSIGTIATILIVKLIRG